LGGSISASQGVDGLTLRFLAQADSLTEEQVSEFKEAFSLFVSLSQQLTLPLAKANALPQDKDGDGKW
jgi:hypothetical protein